MKIKFKTSDRSSIDPRWISSILERIVNGWKLKFVD
jgi:hypothetical protein